MSILFQSYWFVNGEACEVSVHLHVLPRLIFSFLILLEVDSVTLESRLWSSLTSCFQILLPALISPFGWVGGSHDMVTFISLERRDVRDGAFFGPERRQIRRGAQDLIWMSRSPPLGVRKVMGDDFSPSPHSFSAEICSVTFTLYGTWGMRTGGPETRSTKFERYRM